MSRYIARGAQVFIDFTVLSAAYWVAFGLRFEVPLNLGLLKLLFFTWPYVVVFQYLLLVLFGVHRRAWRYVGIKDIQPILGALAVGLAALLGARLGLAHIGGYVRYMTLPIGVLGIDFVLAFMFLLGARVLRRVLTEQRERARAGHLVKGHEKHTLLVGAGRAGVMVLREVLQNPRLGMQVVGFVDDDLIKVGTAIQGVRVLGTSEELPRLIKPFHVEQVVITIASAKRADIRRIVSHCEAASIPVKIIPGLYEILDGRVALSRIREVTIEDLLGRETVALDLEGIGAFLWGKRVLVTGAGGSIGSELCRQVLRFAPSQLVMLEQAENPLFYIHGELEPIAGDTRLIPCIADICDVSRVRVVFDLYRPEVVFHAAAHKHVPLMEKNPGEAVKNNVFGTKHVADAADAVRSEAFVMISTDKAVNPTSVMGATKRVAELYIQDISRRSRTTFVAVRFGNVLGSAGSVIPIFKEQISRGGPVTVTDPEMKRYFMTIPEACQLVMQAAAMGTGGEIFVLDMGEPVKIVDLARDLIRLSGFSEDEIVIEFTGVRPGEKLFEELSVTSEEMTHTRHAKIFIGRIASVPHHSLMQGLGQLQMVTGTVSCREVRAAVSRIVPEMIPPGGECPEVGAAALG